MSYLGKLFSDEKNIHFVFEVSLIFKGVFAALEILIGVFAYFVSQELLLSFVDFITPDDLGFDAGNALSSYLTHAVQNLSVSTQHFTAYYLVSHGIVKLFVIIGLWRKKLWYYPTAIVVFASFIVYQLYRFAFTHSIWLLILTVLDVIVIWLTWHEYEYMKRTNSFS